MKNTKKLNEIKRSPKHAAALLDRISRGKRVSYNDKYGNETQVRNMIPEHPISTKLSIQNNLGDAEIRDVPFHKLYSEQDLVQKQVVDSKIKKTWKKHSSKLPIVMHHVPTDTYHLVDGNHRANEKKLLGHKSLRAHVLTSHQKIGQFREETISVLRRVLKENKLVNFTSDNNRMYSHSANIGGNTIVHKFSDIGYDNWDHSFSVNGTIHHKAARPVPGSEHHIARHVGEVIHSFIQQKQPRSLSYMSANKERHDDGFEKGGKLLAKKTGYVYSRRDDVHDLEKPTLARKVGRKLGLMEKNWIKATKAHIRSEKKLGNKAMHPLTASLIGAALATNIHTGLSMAHYGAAAGLTGAALAGGMTYGILGDHIHDIRRMKKHLDMVDKKKVNESLKTFKTFLEESKVEFKHIGTGPSAFHSNTKMIGPHQVHTSFGKTGDVHDAYEMSFSVDGDLYHKTRNLSHQMQIAHHVGHALNSFLETHKPSSVKFFAMNRQHNQGFMKAAKMIGRRNGYSHEITFGAEFSRLKKNPRLSQSAQVHQRLVKNENV